MRQYRAKKKTEQELIANTQYVKNNASKHNELIDSMITLGIKDMPNIKTIDNNKTDINNAKIED